LDTFQEKPDLRTKIRKIFRQRLGIFLIFAGIATFLWFLQALQKDYVTVIDNPLIFKNLPEGQIQISDLPRKLSMEIESNGLSILRHNWDLSKQPIQIDFRELVPEQRSSNRSRWITVSLAGYRQKIAAQMGNFQIISLFPDTLTLGLAKITKRKVKVIPDVSFETAPEFMLTQPVYTIPDSILVTGPDLLIDTLKGLATDPIRFRRIDKTISRNVSLAEVSEDLKLSDTRVELVIPVEQFTEKTVKVYVEPVNTPDSTYVKTFPSAVNLTFRVAMSQFDKITERDFKVVVDYNEHIEGKTKLKVAAKRWPPGVDQIRLSPDQVEYIIEK